MVRELPDLEKSLPNITDLLIQLFISGSSSLSFPFRVFKSKLPYSSILKELCAIPNIIDSLLKGRKLVISLGSPIFKSSFSFIHACMVFDFDLGIRSLILLFNTKGKINTANEKGSGSFISPLNAPIHSRIISLQNAGFIRLAVISGLFLQDGNIK